MSVGETTTISKRNRKCPKCKSPMQWTEGLLHNGSRDDTKGRYSCGSCHIICKQEDSRALKRGASLVRKYKGVSAWDERILRLSGVEQLGLLRARQHSK